MIGQHEEVAAAACGIEEGQRAEFVMELFHSSVAPGRAISLEGVEPGAEVVEEEGTDNFHNVALTGVVGALLAAFFVFHVPLEERAEYHWGDARPLEVAAGDENITPVALEVSKAEALGEQFTVDTRKNGEIFVEGSLALSSAEPDCAVTSGRAGTGD